MAELKKNEAIELTVAQTDKTDEQPSIAEFDHEKPKSEESEDCCRMCLCCKTEKTESLLAVTAELKNKDVIRSKTNSRWPSFLMFPPNTNCLNFDFQFFFFFLHLFCA